MIELDKALEDIVSTLGYIESRLYSLAEDSDPYYHFSRTEDIRMDVTQLRREVDALREDYPNESLWTPIEEKRPRAGRFVLLKNEDGFVAFACRLKGTDDYFIRKGQKFHNPIAWTTKDRLCSIN